MNGFRYKLAQFMYGRNGVDMLGYALMALYFVVFAVNSLVNTILLTILGFMVVLFMLYRMFSRDLVRRRKENEWFTRIFNRVKKAFKQFFRRVREIKTHRYRTCPACKVTLRLPRKTGKHSVVCPKCKHRFAVRVWI